MKIEYKAGEIKGIDFNEVFEHNCFGDNQIFFTFITKKDNWIKNKDGTFTRRIIKAELIDVKIESK